MGLIDKLKNRKKKLLEFLATHGVAFILRLFKKCGTILAIQGGNSVKTMEILDFVEDKEIQKDDNWYIHATRRDIDTIKSILNTGIKCGYLMNQRGNHFNGRYYISLTKGEDEHLNRFLINCPKFVVTGISPHYADRKKYKFRHHFINTRLPIRTSEWDGEYQQYMKIDKSQIIALEYSLSYLLTHDMELTEQKIEFLKSIITCLQELNSNLPIFDFSSNREINQERVLTL